MQADANLVIESYRNRLSAAHYDLAISEALVTQLQQSLTEEKEKTAALSNQIANSNPGVATVIPLDGQDG